MVTGGNTRPYTYLSFHIHAINLSIESEKFQQGKSWACAAQWAKQSCSGGELYMWHTSTLSSTATATKCIMSVQLQPTILLSTWCAVCYVRFIIQQRQILLDNVHSTATLWGEIEYRHTVHNVLLRTWCVVRHVCLLCCKDVDCRQCKLFASVLLFSQDAVHH